MKGGDSWLSYLSSQVTITCGGGLIYWRWLNTCLLTGSGELIPYFALLVCTAFVYCLKLSLSQSMNFLTFTLPILPPSHRGQGMSKQLCGT